MSISTTTRRIALAIACALASTAAAHAEGGGKTKSSAAKNSKPAAAESSWVSEPAWQPPPSPIWHGLYIGGSVGYGWGTSEHYYDRGNNHGLAENDPSGGLASLTLGYNHMWSPRVLIGVEADLGLMHLSADDKVIFDGHVWKSQFGPLWGTIRGRAGYLWNDRTLFYATAGWAITEVDEVGYGDAAGQTATNESVRSGLAVGAGIEHALWTGMTAKLEYLHMDFGRYDGLSENQEHYSFDNRVDLVRVGLNMKF